MGVQDILRKISTSRVNKVIFHYHLDDDVANLAKRPYETSNLLFVKNLTNVSLLNEFKHPITSQA
jgi:hypothetical protein